MALKLHTQLTFARDIEKIVRENDLGYWEAICEYMDANNIEPESIPKLLSQQLKAILEEETSSLNLINRGKNKPNTLD